MHLLKAPLTTNWSGVTAPVAIVGGRSDTIAPVASHSIPFYNSLRSPKEYVELAGASHFFPQTPNGTVSRVFVSWMKRYVSDDSRLRRRRVELPFDRLLSSRPGTAAESRRSTPFHAVPLWRVTGRVLPRADYARRP